MLAQTSGGQADKKPEKNREQRRDSATLGEDPGNEVIPLDEVNDTDSGDDELHIERTHDISLNAGLPVESGSSELESQPPENSKAAGEEPQHLKLQERKLIWSLHTLTPCQIVRTLHCHHHQTLINCHQLGVVSPVKVRTRYLDGTCMPV